MKKKIIKPLLFILILSMGCRQRKPDFRQLSFRSVRLIPADSIPPIDITKVNWRLVFSDDNQEIISIDSAGKMWVGDSARAIKGLVKILRYKAEHPTIIIFDDGDTVRFYGGDTLRCNRIQKQKANEL